MTNPNTENIRLAVPSDRQAIVACVRAAYTPWVERVGREPAPMQADYAALIARGDVYVVADPDVVGVLVLDREDQTLWIENVAVRPDQQHRGLGRRLLAFAEELATAAGLHELRLYTHERMVENIALYERLGYVEFERRQEKGFKRVFMRKQC